MPEAKKFKDKPINSNHGERQLDHRAMWQTEGIDIADSVISETDTEGELPEMSGRSPESLSDPRLIGSLVSESSQKPFNLDLQKCGAGNSPGIRSVENTARIDKNLIGSLGGMLNKYE